MEFSGSRINQPTPARPHHPNPFAKGKVREASFGSGPGPLFAESRPFAP